MGWANANSIFERTAQELLNKQLPDQIVTDVLAVLIDELYDHDWDTEDESKDVFRDRPAVMAAFKRVDEAHGWGGEDEDDAAE